MIMKIHGLGIAGSLRTPFSAEVLAMAMATLLWLGSILPSEAVDEFAPDKSCKPVSYCVTYQKGEAGQLAGRCIRWAQILPCTPVRAPESQNKPVKKIGKRPTTAKAR